MQYIIVDLEATCWQGGNFSDRMETIEIGAVRLASASSPATDEFARFIRPVTSPVLSDFCTELTSIRQSDVDAAEPFWVVFPAFVRWIGPEPFTLCSWGDYDLNQLRRDCARHKITLPETFENHLNLKRAFAGLHGTKPLGMKAALSHLHLPLDGTHHRGIDDARNIAKIAQVILPQKEAG